MPPEGVLPGGRSFVGERSLFHPTRCPANFSVPCASAASLAGSRCLPPGLPQCGRLFDQVLPGPSLPVSLLQRRLRAWATSSTYLDSSAHPAILHDIIFFLFSFISRGFAADRRASGRGTPERWMAEFIAVLGAACSGQLALRTATRGTDARLPGPSRRAVKSRSIVLSVQCRSSCGLMDKAPPS